MSKFAFRVWLAMLAAMVLFSLSPLAPWGGMIVVFILMIPTFVVLAATSGNASGPIAEHGIELMFLAMGVVIAIFAVIQFYLAADRAEKGRRDETRLFTIFGLTSITIPLAMYLCYKSLKF